MGYSRRTSNYTESITLSDLTHMMSMADPVAIDVETPKIDSGCLTRLNRMVVECTRLSVKIKS